MGIKTKNVNAGYFNVQTRANDIHDRVTFFCPQAHKEDGQPQDAIVRKKVVFFSSKVPESYHNCESHWND